MNDLVGLMEDPIVRWRERGVEKRIWSVFGKRKHGVEVDPYKDAQR